MTLNRIGTLLALLAVICVLAVFFVHSIQGPYSVVHGPVTALLSVRAAVGVRMAIVHAAANSLQTTLASPFLSLSFLADTVVWLAPPGSLVGPAFIFRC